METNKSFGKLSAEERQLISLKIVKAIYSYLQLFISPIVARRIISTILIIAGTRNAYITELTGLSKRGIRDLKNRIVNDDTNSLFEIKIGRGRKPKLEDVESQIVGEIEKSNYPTFQQIADMIRERFGIHVSIMAVSRLLKETKSISWRSAPCLPKLIPCTA